MDILSRIKQYASACPDRPACRSGSLILSYGDLDLYSDRLAGFLCRNTSGAKPEIVVYGHKHPFMMVCFIACIKAGLTYCPVDVSLPAQRLRDIINATNTPLVLSAEPLTVQAAEDSFSGIQGPRILSFSEIEKVVLTEETAPAGMISLGPDDICYIIFTSGSTGRPKGVEIPYRCLCRFTEWGVALGTTAQQKEGKRFLNQAPFSFDLSVMDLYLSLASGGTLCTLTRDVQQQYRLLFDRLKEYQPQIWVSTPSFAEVCLADPDFSGQTFPEMELFLFCGERLTNRTAEKLLDRFPDAKVMNTYGPTESTVAVTEVEVTRELLKKEDPLPVGYEKPGTRIYILSEDGTILPDEQSGEIIITGDTLAAGYFHAPELTWAAFQAIDLPTADSDTKLASTGEFINADSCTLHTAAKDTSHTKSYRTSPVIGYHTGDEGYLKDGMLFYNGRIDLQIKLHGYRIELSDIENNLLRLPSVEQACVVPSLRDGRVSQLHAFVVMGERTQENDRKESALLKEKLSALLPEYMIPRKFHFLSRMPMTSNGKADRKSLKEMLG